MIDEENLTAEQKYIKLLNEAAGKIDKAADKAIRNGVATSLEVEKAKESANKTTWVTFAGQLAVVAGAVYFLVTLLITPLQKQLDAMNTAFIEAQKDIRELYRVIPSEHSDRLDKPIPTKEP